MPAILRTKTEKGLSVWPNISMAARSESQVSYREGEKQGYFWKIREASFESGNNSFLCLERKKERKKFASDGIFQFSIMRQILKSLKDC